MAGCGSRVHRDIARAVERAVRRAGLPVAQSAGFSPHPKISYSGGAPTGAASEAEFLEISLTAAADPGLVRDRLDAALPDGIDVIEVADLAAAPGAAAGGLRLASRAARGRARGRGQGSRGVSRRRARGGGSPHQQRSPRGSTPGPEWYRWQWTGVPRRTGNRMCDTSNGCSAHDTCRATRRHPGCVPPHVGPGACVTTRGDAAGSGAAGRKMLPPRRPACLVPDIRLTCRLLLDW